MLKRFFCFYKCLRSEIIKHKDKLKSLDIVEYNPVTDIDNKTKIIAKTILESLANNL